ncbi:MAG: DUF2586 family protein [Ginsengibacter sp.]
MSVNISRATGQLKRTTPQDDNVVVMVMSGVAEGNVVLGDPKQIFSTDDLATLGITQATNPLAYQEIIDFYAQAGEGAEFNFMLVIDTTSITDICDDTKDLGKKALDFTNGRGVIFLVNVKRAAGYVPNIVNNLDDDINTAMTKLNQMAAAYQAANIPFVGILPAQGFDSTAFAGMPDRSTLSNDYVALNPWCNANDGIVSQGQLAGWLTKLQVHQNAGRVASGKVSDTAYMPDGVEAKTLKYSWDAIAAKGLMIPVKIYGKSGYFYLDDPCMTSKASDYSSISWNRTINKAQRITYGVLVEKQNDDVDIDQSTGKIETGVASDWESDVETAVRNEMMKVSATKQKEISGIKCTVDPASDIANDQIDSTIQIVRKGQAKTINVRIGYAASI